MLREGLAEEDKILCRRFAIFPLFDERGSLPFRVRLRVRAGLAHGASRGTDPQRIPRGPLLRRLQAAPREFCILIIWQCLRQLFQLESSGVRLTVVCTVALVPAPAHVS